MHFWTTVSKMETVVITTYETLRFVWGILLDPGSRRNSPLGYSSECSFSFLGWPDDLSRPVWCELCPISQVRVGNPPGRGRQERPRWLNHRQDSLEYNHNKTKTAIGFDLFKDSLSLILHALWYGFSSYFCAQNNQLLIILATKLRRGEILLQL